MKERINKLLTIKSIVTIITTIVFAILSLKGDIKPNEFILIFSSIIGFYFGTQKVKE
jgi:hypothetical protein